MNPIRLDSYHVSRTYAGVYEGRPAAEDMIESAKRQLEKYWGKDRKVLVFGDEDSDGRLGEWQHMAWLTGPEADPENHGSMLFVIWFSGARGSSPVFDPLQDALTRIEKVGGWSAHAEDFQY